MEGLLAYLESDQVITLLVVAEIDGDVDALARREGTVEPLLFLDQHLVGASTAPGVARLAYKAANPSSPARRRANGS